MLWYRDPQTWTFAVFIGVAYTAFSEWTNTAIRSRQYSRLMPLVDIGNVPIGFSPLAQWLILPLLALYLPGDDWPGNDIRTRSSVQSENRRIGR